MSGPGLLLGPMSGLMALIPMKAERIGLNRVCSAPSLAVTSTQKRGSYTSPRNCSRVDPVDRGTCEPDMRV